jgi:hypothetical protein
MEEIVKKLFLFALVAGPFWGLWSDTLGKTEGLMLRMGWGVAGLLLLALVFGGFQHRPQVAKGVFCAFCAWPVALLVAKGVRPTLSWSSIWLSVFLISWFLVNLIIGLGDASPGAGALGMLLGWIYMPVPFAILSLAFVGGRSLVKRSRRLRPSLGER